MLGSRWLPESSLPSPGMKGDREIREGEGGWREEKQRLTTEADGKREKSFMYPIKALLRLLNKPVTQEKNKQILLGFI